MKNDTVASGCLLPSSYSGKRKSLVWASGDIQRHGDPGLRTLGDEAPSESMLLGGAAQVSAEVYLLITFKVSG